MASPSEADLARLQMVQELELEMMADMYKRMANACHKKCIAPVYHEPDISKGEAVCLDRCVAKYLEIHERVGKKLSAISTQEESAMKQIQADASQPKLPG